MMANSNCLSGWLFKAAARYCAVSFLFFTIAILVPVFVHVADDAWLKYIAINFFISLLTTLCYAIFKMTIGGQNVFSLPLFLILKLFGKDLRWFRERTLPLGGVVLLYALLVVTVVTVLRIKLPEASTLAILFGGLLNLLLPLAWGYRTLSALPGSTVD